MQPADDPERVLNAGLKTRQRRARRVARAALVPRVDDDRSSGAKVLYPGAETRRQRGTPAVSEDDNALRPPRRTKDPDLSSADSYVSHGRARKRRTHSKRTGNGGDYNERRHAGGP